MTKGDEDALERIQDDLIALTLGEHFDTEIKVTVNGDEVTDTIGNMVDNFEDAFKNLNEGALITPTMDTTGLLTALNDAEVMTQEAAIAIEDTLNGIGYTPTLTEVEYPITDEDRANGYVTSPIIEVINGSYVVTGTEQIPLESLVEENGKVMLPAIGAVKNGGGQIAGRKPSSGGGGGGGGGK
jgi:hypothetical protein